MRPNYRMYRLVCFIFVALSLVIGMIATTFWGRYGNKLVDFDFRVYFFAAKTLKDIPNANIYVGAEDRNPQKVSAPATSPLAISARKEGFAEIDQYVYPPVLADLLRPMAFLSFRKAERLWRLINVFFLVVSLLVLGKLASFRTFSLEMAILTVLGICFQPIHESLYLGQIEILLLMLLTIGITAYAKGMQALAAGAFVLAAGIKVTPLMLFPLFVIWWERSILAYYLLFSAGELFSLLLLNGRQMLVSSVHVLSMMGGGVYDSTNKCLNSLVGWIYLGHLVGADYIIRNDSHFSATLPLLGKGVSAAFYVACLVGVWRNRKNTKNADRILVLSVFLLVALNVSPVSWRHAYSIAFLSISYLWIRILRGFGNWLHTALLTVLSFSIGTIFVDYALSLTMPQALKIALAGMVTACSVSLSLLVSWHSPERSLDLTPD